MQRFHARHALYATPFIIWLGAAITDDIRNLRKLRFTHFAKDQCMLSGRIANGDFIVGDKTYKLDSDPIKDTERVHIYGKLLPDGSIKPYKIGSYQTVVNSSRLRTAPVFKTLLLGGFCYYWHRNIYHVRRLVNATEY
jgi:hypothetical protein